MERPPTGAATDWRAVWAVFAGGLVAGAYMTKVAPALPLLRDELGLTLVESGLVATTFNVLGMTVGMLVGVLCDRLGHKQLALLGLIVMAIGGALGAASTSFAMLLSSRFLEGAGLLLLAVSAPALMTAATASAHDRTKAIALWTTYMPAGGSLALLAAPWLIATWGWRGLWTALALAAAVGAALFARAVPRSQYGKVGSLRLVAESLAQKGTVVMALIFFCYVAQWTSVMIWLPTFLIDEHGTSTATAALATALLVLVNAPGNLSAGWLLAKGIRRDRLVVAAALLTALCEVGMLNETLPGGLRFALVLAFSAVSGIIPAAVFIGVPVHAKTPQHIGTGNGIVMQASHLGQFFGPLVFAWIASRLGGWNATLGGWNAALWAMLFFSAAAAALGLVLGRFERKLSR